MGRNAIRNATLSVSPAPAPSLPVTNLQNSVRTRPMRTQDASAHTITAEWSVPEVVSALVMWRHNLSDAATWRIRGWSSSDELVLDTGYEPAVPLKTYEDLDYGVDPYGAAMFTGWPVDAKFARAYFNPIKAARITVEITDPANHDGYIQIDRLMAGRYISPVVNFSYGSGFRWVDESERQRTRGLSMRSVVRPQYRRLSFDLNWLSESDRPKIVEELRAVGITGDVWVSMWPEVGGARERDHSAVTPLTEFPEFSRRSAVATAASVVLEES